MSGRKATLGRGRKTRKRGRAKSVGLASLQKCVRDVCCITFGGFCRGFSWRIFLGTSSHKNETKTKNPATKSATKNRRPKNNTGHFFPQKWRKKIRRQIPRKHPAAQNEKSAKTPFCQKPTLTFSPPRKRTINNVFDPHTFPKLMMLRGFLGPLHSPSLKILLSVWARQQRVIQPRLLTAHAKALLLHSKTPPPPQKMLLEPANSERTPKKPNPKTLRQL